MSYHITKSLLGRAAAFALALSLLGTASVSRAASISYGNFGPIPPGVMFVDVKESSGTDAVPLYGAPTPFTTGLDFDPTSFVSASAGGGADVTDGQLNFTVMAGNGKAITDLLISEAGDYTLAGIGTTVSSVSAGLSVASLKVLEVSGAPVSPITIAGPNASVTYNIVSNGGIGKPWSLGLNVPITVANATKVEVALNNTMLAISEPTSVAFIAKKDFVVGISTIDRNDIVPEPSAIALLVTALGGLGVVAGRRR